jgi:hypothetical protein
MTKLSIGGLIGGFLVATVVVSNAKDFNQDGKPDYLLYNASTRQTAAWYLNNNQYLGSRLGPSITAGWNLIDVADFDGDGNLDYLLYNPSTRQTVIWYLSGTLLRITSSYGPIIPTGWIPVHASDLDGDGKPDYVLYNPTTRQTAFWYLNNNLYVSSGLAPTLAPGYLLVDIGDFNGDGKPDYLIYDPVTRRSAIWFLSGRTRIGSAYGPTVPNGYTLDELADFNHDGRPDYLLNLDRVTALWYLNGNILLGSAYGPTISAGWNLASANSRPCTFSVAPGNATYGSSGGPGSIYVSTLSFGCTWHATTQAGWIHITSGSSWVGSGIVTYTIDGYGGSGTRTGNILVAGQNFTIAQNGAGSTCNVAGTWSGTVTGTFSDGAGCSWTGTTQFSMVVTQSGTSYSGPAHFNGIPCFYDGDCSINDFPTTTGTVTGSVSCPTVTLNYVGYADTGVCSGQEVDANYTLTLSGNTLSGTTPTKTINLTRTP